MRRWWKSLDFYTSISEISDDRREQAEKVASLIDLNTIDRIEVIETGASQNLGDGCFGLLFAHLANLDGGSFCSVDNDKEVCDSSIEIFNKFLPDLEYTASTSDSIQFLEKYDGSPTIVHLDSWDLDIFDPEPAMLHGFLEFQAIESKMESGSYIVVDDNFMRGTFIFWKWNGGDTEQYEVRQEILGKGSMIYHYCKKPESLWELLGEYQLGPNQKLVLRKK